jgi:hypothetical protein
MSKSETLRSFISEICKAVESLSQKDPDGKKILNELANSDPNVFFAAGIRVVAVSQPSEGLEQLILTLARDKRFSMGMLDSSICTLQEALVVARAAAQVGAQLQASFEMALNKALQGMATRQKAELILRILDILSATSDQNCWNSFQVELMAYPDKIVRARAALLIGRGTRNVAWIARRLLDRDTRVQASAVEALWGLDPEEVRPHFLSALKSRDNRVAANAALGLYYSGDVTAMRVLLDMLRRNDAPFQLSALWAIGETRDERFLPALAEYYKHAEGQLHLAAVGAMSRIRRRDKTAHEAGVLQIHIALAAAQTDGLRRLAFALSCHPARDLNGIKPTDFALWENGALVEQYQVRAANPPAVLMAGFVAPWFASADEPYEKALREGLRQCLCMKRPDDMWRIDRYSVEIDPQSSKPQEGVLPYEDSLITPELKAAFGCISDPEALGRILASTAPQDRAAADPIAAFQRQCNAFARRGGKRHVFLLLHDMSGFDLQQEAAIARLRSIAQEGSVVLHGICPDVAGKWPLIRAACLANAEGSFVETTLDRTMDALVDAYANLCSRFEIVYSPAQPDQAGPEAARTANIRLKISSARGYGETEIPLEIPAAAPNPADAAPQSAPPGTSQETPQPA